MLRLITILLATLTLSQQARAIEGSLILQACGSAVRQFDGIKIQESERLGFGLCTGFIAGYLEGFSLGAEGKTAANGVFCPPTGGVDGQQAARILVKYLRETPGELHRPAGESFFVALSTVFPCKQK